MNLSQHRTKARLHLWTVGPAIHSTAEKTIVAMVATDHTGKPTKPITGIDPAHRRIMTEGGDVYELGVPRFGFVPSNPELVKELGFVDTEAIAPDSALA